MYSESMCGISHGGGVDNVWGLMIDCGLRSQGPDTFNKTYSQ